MLAEIEKNRDIINKRKEKAKEEREKEEEAYSGYSNARFYFIVLLLASAVLLVMTDTQRTSRLQLIQSHLGLSPDYQVVEPLAPSRNVTTPVTSLTFLNRLRELQAYQSKDVSTPFEMMEETLKLIESITTGLPKRDDASSLTGQLS